MAMLSSGGVMPIAELAAVRMMPTYWPVRGAR
jgi:hypothetical protein